MRRLKRLCGLILALCLLWTYVPVPALAAESATDIAYALLYADGTLVFQRTDTPDASRSALTDAYTVDLKGGYLTREDVPWYNHRKSVTTVDFADIIAPDSTSCWFWDCENLKDIRNLDRLDTSHVMDMQRMFQGCLALTELNLSSFDTSYVTNMSLMFANCNLTELNLSSFDTSHVTDMSYMFDGCDLTELDVSNFDTSHVTDMSCMFWACSDLTELNLGNFDTSNVTDMSAMFAHCSNLTAIYVSDKFVTSNVKSSESMFDSCYSIVGGNGATYTYHSTDADYAHIDSADAPGYFTRTGAKPAVPAPHVPDNIYALLYDNGTLVFQRTDTPAPAFGTVTDTYTIDLNKRNEFGILNGSGVKIVDFADTIAPISTASWFSGFNELREIRHLERLDTSKVTDMSYMFSECISLTELDLSSFDTSNVIYMNSMFNNAESIFSSEHSSLIKLDLSSFDTSHVTNMSSMFNGCDRLESLDLSGFDTSHVTSMNSMFEDCAALTTIYVGRFDTSNVESMDSMFCGCESLTALDLSGFDTSNVTYMNEMFRYCENLTELNVSGWDTSNVTDMSRMFENCGALATLDISGFDTSNVTNMYRMFDNCFNLTELDVSGFDTSEVANMSWMFYACESLKTLDVSHFDTSNVGAMVSMFDRCETLEALDLSHFDTSEVVDMSWMFAFCSALTKLDLSGFDTSNVTDMYSMFRNCENLKTLDLSGFDTSNVNYMSWMFAGDANLSTIYASDKFVTTALEAQRFMPGNGMMKEDSASMFLGAASLVGGNGTQYDAHFDKGFEYARIDSANAPGYFTRAGAAPAAPNPVPRYVAQILVNDKPLSVTNPESRDYLANGNFFTHTHGTEGSYTLRVLDQYGEEFVGLKWTMDSPKPNASVSDSTVTVNSQAPMNETYAIHASGSGVSVNLVIFVIPDMAGRINMLVYSDSALIKQIKYAADDVQIEHKNLSVKMPDLRETALDIAGIDVAKLIAQGKITEDDFEVFFTIVMDFGIDSYGDESEINIYPTYKITTESGTEVQAEKRMEGFGRRKMTVMCDVPPWFEPVWALHTRSDGSQEYLPVKPLAGLENVYAWEQNGFGSIILQEHIAFRGVLISGGTDEEARDGLSYAITVLKTSGGSVFANVGKARSAAEITLTVIESNGYRLGAIQVQMTGGAAVSVAGSGLTRTFVMPTGNVTVTATFIQTDANPSATPTPELRVTPTAAPSWISVAPTTPTPMTKSSNDKKSPFSDVSVSYKLFAEIVWADSRGIMKGYSNGDFQPGKPVSSITAVVVLGRLDDSSLKNASTGLWYKPYETWANKKGLLKANARNEESIVLQDTVFSRGSMALLLTRYLKSKGRNVTPTNKVTFQDANQMRPGEEAAFQYLYAIGIFQGTSSNRMSPRGHLTRAQLAALLYRLSGVT